MVQRKSEYSLRYHPLSNDIREKIWRENFLFREAQKRMNVSDHYWRFQLVVDDGWDCEDQIDLNADSNKSLVSMPGIKSPLPERVGKQFCPFEEKGVQTPDWKIVTEDIDDIIDKKDLNNVGDQKLLNEGATLSSSIQTSTSQKDLDLKKPEYGDEKSREYGSSSLMSHVHSKHRLTLEAKLQNAEENRLNILKDSIHSKCDGSGPKLIRSQFNPSPTRTLLKSYLQDKKSSPVFAAFGWNDSDKNVGDRKTYNVRAPAGQIHYSALMASDKRLRELELHLAEQLKRKRQHQSLLPIEPVNLSSIWMSEYQESFSRGKREPLVNTRARPVVWRFT